MSDLIERLRALARSEHSDFAIGDEAADEIERLTAALRAQPGPVSMEDVEWAGKVHLAEAIRERDELRRQLDEAEQRFDWLTTRLEDVQIDDADPNDHYYGDEEDVPYPVLWRRAIDAAMRLTRPAEEL